MEEKMLDSSKLKGKADDKLDVTQIMKFAIEDVEKRAECWLPASSSFPTIFSKAFSPKEVKTVNL